MVTLEESMHPGTLRPLGFVGTLSSANLFLENVDGGASQKIRRILSRPTRVELRGETAAGEYEMDVLNGNGAPWLLCRILVSGQRATLISYREA